MKIDELVTRLVKFLENTDYMWDLENYTIYVDFFNERPEPYEEERELMKAFWNLGFHLDIRMNNSSFPLRRPKKELPYLKQVLIAFCQNNIIEATGRLEKLNDASRNHK